MVKPVSVAILHLYVEATGIESHLNCGVALVIELFADKAPVTVNNFVFLSREGYYDGIIFHRVIANFMVQGGDPTGTGRGGPGYKFHVESIDWKKERVQATVKVYKENEIKSVHVEW